MAAQKKRTTGRKKYTVEVYNHGTGVQVNKKQTVFQAVQKHPVKNAGNNDSPAVIRRKAQEDIKRWK